MFLRFSYCSFARRLRRACRQKQNTKAAIINEPAAPPTAAPAMSPASLRDVLLPGMEASEEGEEAMIVL